MLEKVSSYVDKYKMLSKGDRVVLGLSGGADSVALLHVLLAFRQSLGIEIFACHINHGLRGQAADEDQEFCRQLCQKWDLDFFVHQADVRALAKAWQRSEEEAGRIVRYDFYNKLLKETASNRIATGHHKDDQAETILHHIIRGTGIEGLTGIKPVRDHKYIRPLLCVSRLEIEDYLREKGIAYRIDATNLESDYTRNRIRNELLPQLLDYNPALVEGLSRLGSIAYEENDFLSKHTLKLLKERAILGQDYIDFDLKDLSTIHIALQKRLFRLALKKLKGDLDGIGYTHIEDIVKLVAGSEVGSFITLPGGLFARLGYKELRLTKRPARTGLDYFEVSLDIPGQAFIEQLGIYVAGEYVSRDQVVYSDDCIFVDGVKIRGRLRLRQRKAGDRFKSLGMAGSKKLKDYFIDKKIAQDQRDRVPLLVDDDNIIWIVGHQMNEDYKLTSETKRIIKFTFWR